MHGTPSPTRNLAFHRQASDGGDAREMSIITFLKDCTRRRNVSKGIALHAVALRRGLFPQNVFVGSSLVNMYAKFGEIARAQQVFEDVPNPDLVTWNTLIAGYVQHQYSESALDCFQQMKDEGLSPNSVTFSCILKACSDLRNIKKGEEIHSQVSKTKLFDDQRVVGTALVDMYATCGSLAKAQQVFEDLTIRDEVMWNALIKGYIQHGLGDKALKCFSKMKDDGFSPNSVTFISALQACSILKGDNEGREIHCEIARRGLVEKNIMVGTALLDIYAKRGVMSFAKEVFDNLPVQDTVSWNALLSGYCQHGHHKEVLNYLAKMQQEGLSPNEVTFLCALQACSNLECGTCLHSEIMRKGLLTREKALGNALVHLYAGFGALSKAEEVLEELPTVEQAAVTALIQGYCYQGNELKAFKWYKQIQTKGLSPDAVTYSCILNACGSVGAAELGKEVHAEIIEQGLLARDCALSSALVDMYAKCWAVSKANEVFDGLPLKNVECWTTLMTAYAQIGKYHSVFDLFSSMVNADIEPNVVTFMILLNTCSSLGLVNKGHFYFEIMNKSYGIVPTVEHCACMVNLFGRVGHFDRAMAIMKNVPSSRSLSAWFALLEASKEWTNTNLGVYAFNHVVY